MKKEVKFYYVYLITNLILNKQYVGSRMCYKDKIEDDIYDGSSKYLDKDYIIYGKENFTKEILQYDYKDIISMLQGESDYMHKFNTFALNGYNHYDPMLSPHFHTGGCTPSEETKKLWRAQRKDQITVRDKNGNTFMSHIDDPLYISGEYVSANIGLKRSEEIKKKQSEARKGNWKGEKNPMFEKSNYILWVEKFGEEIARQKLHERSIKASISLTGKKRTPEQIENTSKGAKNRKKILCVHCNRIFDSSNYKKYHDENCKYNPVNVCKKLFSIKKQKCPHCNREIGINNYKRYHGDNCKNNPKVLL